jgi:magnesium-protoporphyrin IX monomethyl ester (oxidative) cyclase
MNKKLNDFSVSRATVLDLNSLPIPDYDDYFNHISRLPESDRTLIHTTLPMETSRGCWWGNRRACTFCGLNRGRLTYRTKSPGRTKAELETLATRYGLRAFAMADNIMPPEYYKTLFPELESVQAPYDIFYETRPVLSRRQARQLYAAGVRHVQAGIEALHDELLALMNKGVSVLENITFLKHAREFGITVGWNLLTGFPKDSDAWYRETADWIPLLHHLQPPVSLHGISLQRFSEYMRAPARHGLNPLPYNSYDFVYCTPPSVIRELAYYFRDASWPEFYPEMNRGGPGTSRLMSAVEIWRKAFWSSSRPRLTARQLDEQTLKIVDTRACATSDEIILENLSAKIYTLADEPVDHLTLSGRVSELGEKTSMRAIRDAVVELIDARLAMSRAGNVLSLATFESSSDHGMSSIGNHKAETAFRRYLAEIAR